MTFSRAVAVNLRCGVLAYMSLCEWIFCRDFARCAQTSARNRHRSKKWTSIGIVRLDFQTYGEGTIDRVRGVRLAYKNIFLNRAIYRIRGDDCGCRGYSV
jgi:hypothetical protein